VCCLSTRTPSQWLSSTTIASIPFVSTTDRSVSHTAALPSHVPQTRYTAASTDWLIDWLFDQGRSDGGISVYIPSQNQSVKIILCTNCSRCRPAASIWLVSCSKKYTHPKWISGYAPVFDVSYEGRPYSVQSAFSFRFHCKPCGLKERTLCLSVHHMRNMFERTRRMWSARWWRPGCVVGSLKWNVTDELSAKQLATLEQLDPRLNYEIHLIARSSASDDYFSSVKKLISVGGQPGKRHRHTHTHTHTHTHRRHLTLTQWRIKTVSGCILKPLTYISAFSKFLN